ncbi:hypothetical protein MTO96_022415 [Rhipicephalus appendiculatus]
MEPRQLRRKPPPLPRTDIKIIMRPKKGLAIRNFTTPQISRAVAMAGNSRQHCTGDHFIIRTRPGSNIIIASTPNVDTAQFLRWITTLTLEGKTYAINSYVAAPEDTLNGVIHGIEPGTTPEELTSNLRVRTQGVTVHSARMLGATKAAVITFEGPFCPDMYCITGGGGGGLPPIQANAPSVPSLLTTGTPFRRMPHAERSSVSAVWYPRPRGRSPVRSEMPVVWGCPLNGCQRMLSETQGPTATSPSSTRSTRPSPGAQPPSQPTHSQTRWFSKESETSCSHSRSHSWSQSFPPLPSAEAGQQQQPAQQKPKNKGQKTKGQQQQQLARQQSQHASGKPADKPNSTPSAGVDTKVSWSAEVAQPIAPLSTQSTAYEHLLAENTKLKQELAAVRARQARDSAQLRALMARLGSPPSSPNTPP